MGDDIWKRIKKSAKSVKEGNGVAVFDVSGTYYIAFEKRTRPHGPTIDMLILDDMETK